MHSDERPRLRPGLRFVRHDADAGVAWVVKDPSTQKYFRFGQVEAWLMQQMDGSRSLQQICDALLDHVGMRASPASLEVLVRRLRELGLVERSLQERSALLLEQLRTQRRIRRQSDSTVLRMRFSFGDPDVLMQETVTHAPFFWTRQFVIASVAFFALYTLILVYNWGPFVSAMTTFSNPTQLSLPMFLLMYGLIVVVSVIHELGHGLTCKRFGGEVRELGAMLLYFMPAFYCNISDAWTFPRRRDRLWVTFAGGWIELWIAAIAAIVWVLTEPGTAVNTVAVFTMATAGALSVLFNYNPLVPLDGYYALVDWLEIPNLRARSFEYVGATLKRTVFRLSTRMPAATDRERRIFLAYGIGAFAYSAFLLTFISTFVGRFLVTRLGGWGWVIFLFLLYTVTRKPRRALARVARLFAAEKLPRGRMRRAGAFGALALVLLAGIGAVTPWTVRATVTAMVEPQTRVWVRPVQSARLVELHVREGDTVQPGDTLAVLRDPELELARLQSMSTLQELAARASGARARGAASAARVAELGRAAEQARLNVLERRRNELVLRAADAGVMVTPRVEQRIGENIAAGDSLLEIWRTGEPRVRVRVPQQRGGEMRAGATLRIRFPAHPGLTWRTSIEHVEEAAENDDLIGIAALPTAPGRPLLPGMVGRARVDVARTTLAGAFARTARRITRLDLLL